MRTHIGLCLTQGALDRLHRPRCRFAHFVGSIDEFLGVTSPILFGTCQDESMFGRAYGQLKLYECSNHVVRAKLMQRNLGKSIAGDLQDAHVEELGNSIELRPVRCLCKAVGNSVDMLPSGVGDRKNRIQLIVPCSQSLSLDQALGCSRLTRSMHARENDGANRSYGLDQRGHFICPHSAPPQEKSRHRQDSRADDAPRSKAKTSPHIHSHSRFLSARIVA